MVVPIYCTEKNCIGCEHYNAGDYYNPPECDVGGVVGIKEQGKPVPFETIIKTNDRFFETKKGKTNHLGGEE